MRESAQASRGGTREVDRHGSDLIALSVLGVRLPSTGTATAASTFLLRSNITGRPLPLRLAQCTLSLLLRLRGTKGTGLGPRISGADV
jgi:hypothetical protein